MTWWRGCYRNATEGDAHQTDPWRGGLEINNPLLNSHTPALNSLGKQELWRTVSFLETAAACVKYVPWSRQRSAPVGIPLVLSVEVRSFRLLSSPPQIDSSTSEISENFASLYITQGYVHVVCSSELVKLITAAGQICGFIVQPARDGPNFCHNINLRKQMMIYITKWLVWMMIFFLSFCSDLEEPLRNMIPVAPGLNVYFHH